MFDRRGTRGISRRGGRRAGAGRKPVNEKTNGPANRQRAPISGRHPVSVTMRFHDSIRKNLRAPRFFTRIRACLVAAKVAAKVGGGARLCHFSVQKNHIHLIVEPPAGARGSGVEKALANAMRGLAIGIARTLNGALGRRGSAFAHRYHSRELASPLEVKRALNYVIHNGRKHHLQAGEGKPPGWSDPCCSAAFVPAWSRRSRHLPAARAPAADDPVAAPRTWLLRTGWHEKHGGLDAFASLKLSLTKRRSRPPDRSRASRADALGTPLSLARRPPVSGAARRAASLPSSPPPAQAACRRRRPRSPLTRLANNAAAAAPLARPGQEPPAESPPTAAGAAPSSARARERKEVMNDQLPGGTPA